MPAICRDLVNVFCIENNIENLASVSTNIFHACLTFIRDNTVRLNQDLYKYDNKVNNAYDFDKLAKGVDNYIAMCQLYDNAVSVLGCSIYLGLTHVQIYEWQAMTTPRKSVQNNKYINTDPETVKKDCITGSELFEKLRYFEELTTLSTKKYNDLRIIARLNRLTQGAYRDYTQVDTLQTHSAEPAQIADKYRDTKLLQGDAVPELPTTD